MWSEDGVVKWRCLARSSIFKLKSKLFTFTSDGGREMNLVEAQEVCSVCLHAVCWGANLCLLPRHLWQFLFSDSVSKGLLWQKVEALLFPVFYGRSLVHTRPHLDTDVKNPGCFDWWGMSCETVWLGVFSLPTSQQDNCWNKDQLLFATSP